MLSDIIDVLADPIDGTALAGVGDFAHLVSESGHNYDVAKQGYVTLAGGKGLAHGGDSSDMIAAREAFLSAGHFAPFVESVTAAVTDALDDADVPVDGHPAICEVGAGTGYYLAHTLDSLPEARGVGIDVSTAAAKALAKSHPRTGAVVADVWEGLPLRDHSIDVVSVVFAPRNAAEFARVLKDEGQVIALTPEVGHLAELREPLGILQVEQGKYERMVEQAAGHLTVLGEPELIEFPMRLDRTAIQAQVGMSPSARHIDAADLYKRVTALPETMKITARARLTRFARV